MRLKFRAKRKNGELIYSDKCGLDLFFAQVLHEKLEPQPFTGLKDKNGKEIYEGDILYFGKDEGLWADQINKIIEVKFPFICNNAYLGEIIGTIYENPELLVFC